MTVKKSLENRIRCWFPQEATMISTRLIVNHENKQPPLIIPPEYNVSATKLAGGFAVLWIILFGFIIFDTSNLSLRWYNISLFQIVAWIIAGLVVGVISGTIFARNQLGRLSKDFKFSANKKDAVVLIVPMGVFFIFGGFVSWFLQSSLELWAILVYSWALSYQIPRVLLFAVFEKNTNMRLMQSWWGSTIILVPKAPTLEMATKQRH
jgi:hypothetical protein